MDGDPKVVALVVGRRSIYVKLLEFFFFFKNVGGPARRKEQEEEEWGTVRFSFVVGLGCLRVRRFFSNCLEIQKPHTCGVLKALCSRTSESLFQHGSAAVWGPDDFKRVLATRWWRSCVGYRGAVVFGAFHK